MAAAATGVEVAKGGEARGVAATEGEAEPAAAAR
jgi:hypothetical protein